MASVAALLSLLDEPDPALQGHALEALLPLVDAHWALVAEKIVRIEELAELPNFAFAKTAATLVSARAFRGSYAETAGKDWN